MKAKLLAAAVFSALSAGAIAQTTYIYPTAPAAQVPDATNVITAPAATVAVPSASAGSSATVVTPAPVAPGTPIVTAPAVVATPAVVVPAAGPWVSQQPGASGPGAVDKTRMGDTSVTHSPNDVGTSSAGG